MREGALSREGVRRRARWQGDRCCGACVGCTVFVFLLTASCSLFAYLWMIVVVSWWTPGYVTVEEGVLTFLCFPAMIAAA